MAKPSTPWPGLVLIAALCALCSCSSPSPASNAQSDAGAANMQGTDAPSGTVGCESMAGADSYVPGMKKPGAAGLYNFQLVSSMPAPPALNDNQFVVQVTQADGTPVSGQLRVAMLMPQHGHQGPPPPQVSFDSSARAFTLDPLDLFMVGLWQFTFSFTPDNGEAGAAGAEAVTTASDSAVFEFCID